jgi:hypothetical protein
MEERQCNPDQPSESPSPTAHNLSKGRIYTNRGVEFIELYFPLRYGKVKKKK